MGSQVQQDAMETAFDSGNTELAESLLRFFVDAENQAPWAGRPWARSKVGLCLLLGGVVVLLMGL